MVTYKVLAEFADVVKQLSTTFPFWIERKGVLLEFKWCVDDDAVWVIGYPFLEDNEPPAWLLVGWERTDDGLSLLDSRRFLSDDELDLYLTWFEETHNGRTVTSNQHA